MIHEREGRQICCRKTRWAKAPSIQKHGWNRRIGLCYRSLFGYAIKTTFETDFPAHVALSSFNQLVAFDSKLMISCQRTKAAARTASHHGARI